MVFSRLANIGTWWTSPPYLMPQVSLIKIKVSQSSIAVLIFLNYILFFLLFSEENKEIWDALWRSLNNLLLHIFNRLLSLSTILMGSIQRYHFFWNKYKDTKRNQQTKKNGKQRWFAASSFYYSMKNWTNWIHQSNLYRY